MSILDPAIYEIIGKIVLYIIVIALFLIIVTIVQFTISLRTKRFIAPTFQDLLIDTFFPIIRNLIELINKDPKIIEEFNIKLKNRISEKKFSATPVSKRIVVFPQCLRSLSCPAKLSAEKGLQCKECGKCEIFNFINKADKIGYKTYIVPGGTFVKRIITSNRPKAVLAVACFTDLAEGMKIAQRANIAAQGVLLETKGCVETTVDWQKVYDKLYLGIPAKEI